MPAHLTLLGLFTTNKLRSFVTFWLSASEDFQLPTLHKILLGFVVYLVDFSLSSDTVTLTSIAETLNAYLHCCVTVLAQLATLNHDKSSSLSQGRITHGDSQPSGHHWLKYILDYLFMNYWIIFCDTKYHLEILIFEIFLKQSYWIIISNRSIYACFRTL